MRVARSECTTCTGSGTLMQPVIDVPPGFARHPYPLRDLPTRAEQVPCPDCYEEQPVNDKNIKIEPDAEMRRNAFVLRQWYIALTDQGFTEDEALRIIGAQIGGPR